MNVDRQTSSGPNSWSSLPNSGNNSRAAQDTLIVLAPAWPGETRGCDIALRASLLLYLKYFRKVHFICISAEPFRNADEWPEDRVSWIQAPTVDSPKWLRFLQSLKGAQPAVAVRYARAKRAVMGVMREIVACCSSRPFLIVEDIPTACFVGHIAREFPDIPVAIRSFNIIEKGFEPLCRTGSYLHRLCWRYEVARVRRFEKEVCERVNKVWAISAGDARDYSERLAVETDGVVGICMDVDRYAEVPDGDPQTIVHVGTADLRKGKGLTDFIECVWPRVRSKVAGARLVLAGRGTDKYANRRLGIEGLGFVGDDRDVLKQGRIFVNTQQIGAGIQLKSVVAMLAGKALISTPMAAEGIDGEDGKHFVVGRSLEQMAAQISYLALTPDRTAQIGRDARELATVRYSLGHFFESSRVALEDFVCNDEGARAGAERFIHASGRHPCGKYCTMA